MKETHWYESSKGEGLSLTIGGLSVAGLVPVVVNVLKLVGLDVAESEVAQIVTLGLTITGSSLALLGIIRKIWNRIRPEVRAYPD